MEFRRVEEPVFFPAACFCGNQKGPLVDTLVETLNGRLYLCGRCVSIAATGLGWTRPDEVEELSARLGEVSVRLEEVSAELEAERGNRLVPESELAMLRAKLEEDRQERRAFERAWTAAMAEAAPVKSGPRPKANA